MYVVRIFEIFVYSLFNEILLRGFLTINHRLSKLINSFIYFDKLSRILLEIKSHCFVTMKAEMDFQDTAECGKTSS